MRKIALLALVAAGFLALAGAAQAKELVSLRICGASGCNSASDQQLRDWSPESNTNPPNVSVTYPASYYTVDIAFGHNGEVVHQDTAYWLPDTSLMRYRSQTHEPWWKLFADQAAVHKEVAAGIEPFSPTVSKVTFKGRTVSDPNSYLRLFGKFQNVGFPRGTLHLASIVYHASEPNPWVSGVVTLRYDAKRRLLIRSDGYFRLPHSLARLLTKRASLAASSSDSSGGGHAGLYAGLGVGGAVALAVLALARRKRMRQA